jgi:tetratricopeptide (TPR) repeat protein
MKESLLFEEALGEFGKGLYHKAIASFREAIARDSEDDGTYAALSKGFILECYKLLGIKYTSQQLHKQALDILEQGLAEYPDNRVLLFYKGVILNNSGNFPVSVRMFESIFALEPGFPSIRVCLGIALLNVGNLDRTEEILHGAISLPPFDATVYHLLAIARFRRHAFPEVEKMVRRALELKRPFPEAQLDLMAVCIVLKRYGDAFQILEELIPFLKQRNRFQVPLGFLAQKLRLQPDHPLLRKYAAGRSDGEINEAAARKWVDERFHKTIEIDVQAIPFQDPEGDIIRNSWFRQLLVKHYQNLLVDGIDLPEVYFRLGREAQRLKKHSEALEHFRRCLARNPSFIPAKISLAFCYKDLGRTREAIETFEESYRDFKSVPETILFSNETAADEKLGNEKAEQLRAEIHILNLALGQNPGFADLYYNLGRLYYYLEQPDEAYQNFEKACTLNPFYVRAVIGQALTLMQLNQTERASELLNTLTTRNNLFWKVVYNLAILHHRNGDTARARELLEELLPLENEFAAMARDLLARLPS